MSATRLVHAEVRKLATLPALRLIALLTVIGTMPLAAVAQTGEQVLRIAQAGLLLLGVFATAHEFQAGAQIRTTLLAAPRRLVLAAAKAVALLIVAVPVATAVASIATIVDGRIAEAPAAVGYLAATSLLAAAVGLLVRQALAAVTVLLPVYLIAAPLLRARSPGGAAWLPDTALSDPARGAAALLVWTATISLLAVLTWRVRDA